MLVLSRKQDESIVIGGRIRVTVVEVKGGVVRLGIEAPREIPVYRSELLKASRQPAVAAPILVGRAAEPLALVH